MHFAIQPSVVSRTFVSDEGCFTGPFTPETSGFGSRANPDLTWVVGVSQPSLFAYVDDVQPLKVSPEQVCGSQALYWLCAERFRVEFT